MLVTSPSVRRPGTNEHEECGHNARAHARWRTREMSYKEKLALKILQLFALGRDDVSFAVITPLRHS